MNQDCVLASHLLRRERTSRSHRFSGPVRVRLAALLAAAFALVLRPSVPATAQALSADTDPSLASNLPDAPWPHWSTNVPSKTAQPCQVKNTGATMAATGAIRALAVSGLGVLPAHDAGTTIVETKVCIPHLPIINWYARFLTGPDVKPFTAKEKARLAVHNLLDPFNLITIGGDAAIAVGANSHSGYGPGIPGWGRYVGVSFTQDMTGELFDTFLIPSLTHQDPHYHRMPNASIRRRALHAATQVFWTQGDKGNGMLNYGDLVGFAIDDEISNLYVPGQSTRASATATRYATGIATAPIDNFVIEFLPDVARHIHLQIVILQRVINQVARTNAVEEP